MTRADRRKAVLRATSSLANALDGLARWAGQDEQLAQDVTFYRLRPDREPHPCGAELDSICEALLELYPALGAPPSVKALAEAAGRFYHGED